MGIGSCFFFSKEENSRDEFFKLLEDINEAKDYIVKCILFTEYQLKGFSENLKETNIRTRMEIKKLQQKKEGMKKAQMSYENMHNLLITQQETENVFITMKQTRKVLQAQKTQFIDYTTFGTYFEIDNEFEKPKNLCGEDINATLTRIENLPACPEKNPNLNLVKNIPILNG